MKVETTTYYVANDGSRFRDKNACLQYEQNIKIDVSEKLPDLYVEDLNYNEPFEHNFDGFMRKSYQWFLLKSRDDLNRFKEAFSTNTKINFSKISSYFYNKFSSKTDFSEPILVAIELSSPNQMMSEQKNPEYTGKVFIYNEEVKKFTTYKTTIDKAIESKLEQLKENNEPELQ